MCVFLLRVFTFLISCCDVRYYFRIKRMFGSSLPPVVCRRAHVFFTLLVDLNGVCVCVCLNVCLFVCRRLVYPILPVSLNCPFLIAPSVFSNVYISSNIYTWIEHNLYNLYAVICSIKFSPMV